MNPANYSLISFPLLGLELNQKVVSRVETGLRVVPDFELAYYARALDTDVLWLLGLR